jgi:putative PIN family toxin of toxin-antitoxin system
VINAVLDTNVLASGFIGLTDPESAPGELLRRWRNDAFTLVVSDPILTELTRVFSYPYFTRRLTATEIDAAFSLLRTEALNQPLTVDVVGVAAHPQDDLILATALSAEAQYLVTGDKRLRERVAYRGTLLLTPRQFLDILDQHRNERAPRADSR